MKLSCLPEVKAQMRLHYLFCFDAASHFNPREKVWCVNAIVLLPTPCHVPGIFLPCLSVQAQFEAVHLAVGDVICLDSKLNVFPCVCVFTVCMVAAMADGVSVGVGGPMSSVLLSVGLWMAELQVVTCVILLHQSWSVAPSDLSREVTSQICWPCEFHIIDERFCNFYIFNVIYTFQAFPFTDNVIWEIIEKRHSIDFENLSQNRLEFSLEQNTPIIFLCTSIGGIQSGLNG